MALIGHVVSEEKTFEIVDGRTTTTDHGYPISSPMSLWLRWAKNIQNGCLNTMYIAKIEYIIFYLFFKHLKNRPKCCNIYLKHWV